MAYTFRGLGALGADCHYDPDCYRACNGAYRAGTSEHQGCVQQCPKIGSECNGAVPAVDVPPEPGITPTQWLMIGGGVLALGAVAWFALK